MLRKMLRVVRPGGMVAFTLTPRDWRVFLEPLLRLRRLVKETLLVSGGPSGLYRREWIGIRPQKRTVMRLLPEGERKAVMHGDNWLFVARRHSAAHEAMGCEVREKVHFI